MAKTYAQLQQQIAQLQRTADALKAKEVRGVIDRIKLAIDQYGLTPDDLFGRSTPAAPKARKTGTAAAAGNAAKKAGRTAPAKPPKSPRFADDAGNTWTGHGKRPRWFLAAIASGKTARDLEIRPTGP